MVHTGRAIQALLVPELNVPECPVWLGQENKRFKKVLEETGHRQSGRQLGGIWQAPMLSRSVKQLDGDLKQFLSSVEENLNLEVQSPVMGWSICNAEMGAQNPTGPLVFQGWVSGCHSMAWTSVETEKVKEKWGVAGKNMKCTINMLMQQICVKANITFVTENNKSKEICS